MSLRNHGWARFALPTLRSSSFQRKLEQMALEISGMKMRSEKSNRLLYLSPHEIHGDLFVASAKAANNEACEDERRAA